MNYYEVAPTKIVRAGVDFFTYASEAELSVGQLVIIEVGKKQLTGVILRSSTKPDYATKPIVSIVDETPLPSALIELSLWLSNYYSSPLATVLQTVLPSGLTKKRRHNKVNPSAIPHRKRTKIVFSQEQTSAIDTITSSPPGTFLLQGVTGSGKTEIYKELARQTIANGQSVIILTPEIGLTPQMVAEFTDDFPNVLVTHSRQTEAERHKIWLEALHNPKAGIVIGPRSALFTPLKQVGLIVVDEAHEPSYKQEQSPRYSALRAATMLGKFSDAKVIFGSATPSLLDRYLAEQSGKPIITLKNRAQIDTVEPSITLIDSKDRSHFKNHRFISDKLLGEIENNLANKTQTLIFHNRRGSTTTTLCTNCGWTAMCPNCFIPLTLHADSYDLRCHLCGYHEKVPASCPACHQADIIHKGIGTKLIESELKRLFPKANIARFDADNTIETTLQAQYQDLYDGKIDIAIGTQVVAKGLDLPLLRTVGVLQADSGLALPDYASEERVFQLLSQVVGRVGRNRHQTNIYIQTYQPDNPVIKEGISQDYEAFYNRAIAERQKNNFPPFVYLLKLTCVYKTERAAITAARNLAQVLRTNNNGVQVLGPTPAFYERVGDTYRWQLTLKSKKREKLVEMLKLLPPTHWQAEIDPISLL